jgi:hypothetical protein
MTRVLLTAGLLVAVANTLSAQAVYAPDPALPPEHKVVADAIYQLRDSLNLIGAAGARLALDRQGTSDASLRSRATLLAGRCRTALPVADSTKAIVLRGAIPSPDPRGAVKRFDKAIADVRAKLAWCDSEFTRLTEAKNAEELRGYGIGKAQQVTQVTQLYVNESALYLKSAMNARYKPNTRGAGATPSTGRS